MSKRRNTMIFSGLTVIVLIILAGTLINKVIFLDPKPDNCEIGIVDGKLTEYNKVDTIVLSKTELSSSTENSGKTHGDEIVEFANNYCKNIKIFYFDASDENGMIRSERIIEGIIAMAENNVNTVNISLSSIIKDSNLQKTIEEVNLTVFSSYSNTLNSLDYPAMYPYVLG